MAGSAQWSGYNAGRSRAGSRTVRTPRIDFSDVPF